MRRFLSWAAAAPMLVLCLVAAGPAGAAVTHTTITSPASDQIHVTRGLGDSITFSGTSDGTTGDTVSLQCRVFPWSGITTLGAPIEVTSDGSWTTTLDVDGLPYIDRGCVVRATAGEWTGLNQFPGRSLLVSELFAGPADSFARLNTPRLRAELSSDGCARASAYAGLGDPFGGPRFWYQFDCLADPWWGVDHLATALRVDGNDAITATRAYSINSGDPDLPTPLATRPLMDTSGAVSHTEGGNLVVCDLPTCAAVDPDPAGYGPAGVRLERTIRAGADGSVRISRRFSSTDGAAHTVEFRVNADTDEGYFSTKVPWVAPDYVDWTCCEPTTYAGPTSVPQTIRIKWSNFDETFASPWISFASLTLHSAPADVTVNGGTLWLHYVIDVPATGGVDIDVSYAQGRSSAEVDAAIAAIEDADHAPAIAIASPAAGLVTTDARVLVTGTASDANGIAGVTVDGTAAFLGANGAWQALVSLADGQNTINAVVTDKAGLTASAAVTVTRKVDAPPTNEPAMCIVPNLIGLKLAKARTTLKAANCRLGKVVKVRSAQPRGTIIRQRQPSGWTRKANAWVGVIVSRGRGSTTSH